MHRNGKQNDDFPRLEEGKMGSRFLDMNSFNFEDNNILEMGCKSVDALTSIALYT
jgi:hypothetical protein